MIVPMAQTQNLPQHLTIMGNPYHHGSAMVPDSPIASFASSLGEAVDYRNPHVQALPKSSSRSWQVPATSSDLHIPTRWPNNSIESSSGHCSPSLDSFTAAYSELFDSPMRSASADGQQQFVDGSTGRYSASVASMLSGGSSGLARTLSSPLGGALGSTSPRLNESWTSTVDHGNLGLTVDPSKGGLALQGAGRPNTPSLPRFSTNPGFAERAARFSAFGNGQYSPSFALAENGNGNGNGGRSPCFENDSSKRAKVSVGVGVSRRATSATEVPERILPEGRGAAKGREEKNTKGEPKASSASKPITPLIATQVEQDDTEKGRSAADEVDSLSSDSDASEGNLCQQEASCSDQVVANQVRTTSTTKKRKSSSADDPVKEGASPSSKDPRGSGGHSRRSKDGEGANDAEEQKAKSEWSGSENSEKSNSPASKERSKALEQPKLDYIHVRARRGQATDSHSLAERVRREKISERMKYLQDLVPGCSKVTGKAVMLDEIINYVQSIQRQVEFLSMKLAAVTPRPDFSIDNVVGKQVQMQIGNNYGLPNVVEHSENSPSFAHIQSQHSLHIQHGITHNRDFQPAADVNIRRVNGNAVPFPRTPMEAFDVGKPQVQSPWDGDLQSVVQMGYGQGMQGFGSSGLQCDLPPGHMKMEL